ncbi:MAG: hypothetical protein FH753_11125 [Firmicutes bacterium]|nr:hypothetical protein [Bacillota bacterium]
MDQNKLIVKVMVIMLMQMKVIRKDELENILESENNTTDKKGLKFDENCVIVYDKDTREQVRYLPYIEKYTIEEYYKDSWEDLKFALEFLPQDIGKIDDWYIVKVEGRTSFHCYVCYKGKSVSKLQHKCDISEFMAIITITSKRFIA